MSAFLDAEGRPRLRESVTAFMDVLGFSHAVLSAADAGESERLLRGIAGALDDAKGFVRRSLAGLALADSSRWRLKFFSDNLLLGYPVDKPEEAEDVAAFVVRCAQRYQLQMALRGYFVRGAVTIGPLCITDDIIFGTALIDSYRLEAKTSIVPRVIVTEKVKSSLMAAAARPGPCDARDLLCRDIDGWWFINYLQSAVDSHGVSWELIEQHKREVLASLTHTAHHDILPKFGWACRYHNVFCHWHRDSPGYSEAFQIRRADEESAIGRMCDFLSTNNT